MKGVGRPAVAPQGRLLEKLNERFGGAEHDGLKRRDVIDLLNIVRSNLTDTMCSPLSTLKDGTAVELEHPATEILMELIDALCALDKGLTHEVLTAYSHGSNASLSAQQRKQDEALKVAILAYQKDHGIKSRIAACRKVARALNSQGFHRRGEAVTGKSLDRLFRD